ncbi:hypothetical protein [Prauserella alba]|uniref:Uncharacterized protein n=1 Tax=Prauserella alba TaxID=176898 RepID=A0ABN1VID6_9PSEU|nr:hypothetical protein [Prauserella alba]MCP2183564.1 hypothetical protein [Prauserella alba]
MELARVIKHGEPDPVDFATFFELGEHLDARGVEAPERSDAVQAMVEDAHEQMPREAAAAFERMIDIVEKYNASMEQNERN